MVGIITFIVLNVEVIQVSINRSRKGKTNLVHLRKNLRERQKQTIIQTLKGKPVEEERERSIQLGKLSPRKL